MSFLGPGIFLANRNDFKKRLSEQRTQELTSLTQSSYQEIDSYQNNSLRAAGYIYKIKENLCFIKTTDNVKMVMIRNSNKIYHLNQRIIILKDFSKLPYSKNKFFCFSEKYYYAVET